MSNTPAQVAAGPTSTPAKPSVNLSPRSRFQSKPANLTNHRATVDSESFERSSDAAMLEYCNQLALSVRDSNTAMAAGFRLLGAVEYQTAHKTLAEPPPPMPVRRDPDNLIPITPTRQ